MRILQLIDSLEAGGAERMAVNYANALAHSIEFSALVATRAEGPLKGTIAPEVVYFFMSKKKTVDVAALFRLRSFVIQNRVTFVQAHSSSFFTAVLLKMLVPSLRLFWHDHYGARDTMRSMPKRALKISSLFFNGVIVVNNHLKIWAELNLFCRHVICLNNFVPLSPKSNNSTYLNNRNTILLVANLRNPKNHLLALKAFAMIKHLYPDWKLCFLGKDKKDDYSKILTDYIVGKQLQSSVTFLESTEVESVIQEATICILTSESEGLPVALLEYGKFAKPVVVTDVGQVSSVVEHHVNGLVVPSGDVHQFAEALKKLIDDEQLRNDLGQQLFQRIKNNHTFEAVSTSYFQHLNRAK